MADELRARTSDELDPERGLGRVRRTGEPLLVSEITDDLLVAAAVDAAQLDLLRAVGLRSVLMVPMMIRGEAIGALTLVDAESGRSFDDSDVPFAEADRRAAARAVENARLYTERSDVARTLQRSLLPEALPRIPGSGRSPRCIARPDRATRWVATSTTSLVSPGDPTATGW